MLRKRGKKKRKGLRVGGWEKSGRGALFPRQGGDRRCVPWAGYAGRGAVRRGERKQSGRGAVGRVRMSFCLRRGAAWTAGQKKTKRGVRGAVGRARVVFVCGAGSWPGTGDFCLRRGAVLSRRQTERRQSATGAGMSRARGGNNVKKVPCGRLAKEPGAGAFPATGRRQTARGAARTRARPKKTQTGTHGGSFFAYGAVFYGCFSCGGGAKKFLCFHVFSLGTY